MSLHFNQDPHPRNQYSFRPGVSLAASVALTASVNLLMYPTIIDGHHDVESNVRAAIDPRADAPIYSPVQQVYRQHIGRVTMPYSPHFADSPEAASVNPSDVSAVIDRIQDAKNNDEQNVYVVVTGQASDEAGALPSLATDPNRGLGETNDRNETLASVRGQAVAVQLGAALRTAHMYDVDTLVMPGKEHVLEKSQVSHFGKLATKYGLSLNGLIDTYNGNQTLPEDVRQVLDANLGQHRGADVEIHATRNTIIAPVPVFKKKAGQEKLDEKDPKPFQDFPHLPPRIPVIVPVSVMRRRPAYGPLVRPAIAPSELEKAV